MAAGKGKNEGMVNYTKDGAFYQHIDKTDGKGNVTEHGDKANFAYKLVPSTNTLYMVAEAGRFRTADEVAKGDGPFLTSSQGVHPTKDYATDLVEKTQGEAAADGNVYGEGTSSFTSTSRGAMPNLDTLTAKYRGAKTPESKMEAFDTPRSEYNAVKAGLEGKAAPEAAKEAERETAKDAPARKQFTGREFDVRKDTPGYDALKTATHEPTDKANFLVKVYESGHVTAVNNPRGDEPGGYLNGVAGMADALEASGAKAIDLPGGVKGYDVMMNVEFGDKGLQPVEGSIEQREGGIEKPVGFERRFSEAKGAADANAATYEAEASAEKDASTELGA